MEKRRCGAAALELSALGLGCWAFGGGDYWGPQSQAEVEAVVRRAVELGVNYFDTAEAYNQGASETSLGQALRDLPREQLVIGTKISPSNTDPATLVAHCEASLRRLGTDYLDVYMVHWPITPQAIKHFSDRLDCPSVAAAFATLEQLRRQGKIRHMGVSNFGVERLEEARRTGADIVLNELPYNLLARAIEYEILPHCRRTGVGVLGYMALMQGLLADRYPTFDAIPLWQRRTRHFHPRRADALCRHGEAGAEEETRQAIDALKRLAVEHGRTLPEIALSWALAGDGITCVLVGCRTVQELERNVAALEHPLPPAWIERLNQVTEPLLRKLGLSFDYYENPRNDRTR